MKNNHPTSLALLLCFGLLPVLFTACGSQKAQQEATANEAQRLAEQQALLHDKIASKREQAAVDLESRSQSRNAKRSELLDQAASEQVRRESMVIDIRDSIDAIDIVGERASDAGPRYVFSGKIVKEGELFRSPLGYTYVFDRKEGDLFKFSYEDRDVVAKFSRPRNGVAIVSAKQLRDVAPGIPPDDLNLITSSAPRVEPGSNAQRNSASRDFTDAYAGRSLTILKATYGAGNTQRDVRPFITAKISGGRCELRADNSELGGDPCSGQVKTLFIKYAVNGRTYEKSWREGESGSIP